jgi:hypothetical protein
MQLLLLEQTKEKAGRCVAFLNSESFSIEKEGDIVYIGSVSTGSSYAVVCVLGNH